MKSFVDLEYSKVLEFSQVYGHSLEDARDILTYIVEHGIVDSNALSSVESASDDELQVAYESGWADAIDSVENSLPARWDCDEYIPRANKNRTKK